MSETGIRHRQGDGTFKAHPASTSSRPSTASTLTPEQIQAFKLSISDEVLQQVLDHVGEQLLALRPAAADPKERVGYMIPGRVPYAVRYACWDCQGYWPSELEFQLVTVPDTVQDQVLPPEFVRMLDPAPVLAFTVEAWA